MRFMLLSGTLLVACANGYDPCPARPLEAAGADHYYDEAWAMNGHNMVVWDPSPRGPRRFGPRTSDNPIGQVPSERPPIHFDDLLDAMDQIGAEFRCYSEEEQRGFTWPCYLIKLPPSVCWDEAQAHFSGEPGGSFPPFTAWLAELPEERCDCAIYPPLE